MWTIYAQIKNANNTYKIDSSSVISWIESNLDIIISWNFELLFLSLALIGWGSLGNPAAEAMVSYFVLPLSYFLQWSQLVGFSALWTQMSVSAMESLDQRLLLRKHCFNMALLKITSYFKRSSITRVNVQQRNLGIAQLLCRLWVFGAKKHRRNW